MTTVRPNVQQQIISKAMKDEAFRQRLLSNPRETLEREMGMILPQGVNVQMHEDTATMLHLVLPMKSAVSEVVELSDAQLAQAAGGKIACDTYPYPNPTCP